MVTLDMVKVLIENQSLAYNNVFESSLKQFLNKVSDLESAVADLKKSLEYSQEKLDDLKKEMKQLKSEKQVDKSAISDLQHELSESQEATRRAEAHCNALDDQHRRNNIMIDGLPEDATETSEHTMLKVQGLIKDNLELPELPVEMVQRLGHRREDRPRPVLVRFPKLTDRDAAMRNARKLKGTRIFLNDDLCPASQKIKSDQLPAMRAAHKNGQIAYFLGTKLVIKDRDVQPDLQVQTIRTPTNTSTQSEPGRPATRSQSTHPSSSS